MPLVKYCVSVARQSTKVLVSAFHWLAFIAFSQMVITQNTYDTYEQQRLVQATTPYGYCKLNQETYQCDVDSHVFVGLLAQSDSLYAKFLQCQYIEEQGECQQSGHCDWINEVGKCSRSWQEVLQSIKSCFYNEDNPANDSCFMIDFDTNSKFELGKYLNQSDCALDFFDGQSVNTSCQIQSEKSTFCGLVFNLDRCIFQPKKRSQVLTQDNDQNVCSQRCQLLDSDGSCSPQCFSQLSALDRSIVQILTAAGRNLSQTCANDDSECAKKLQRYWYPPSPESQAAVLFQNQSLRQQYLQMVNCRLVDPETCNFTHIDYQNQRIDVTSQYMSNISSRQEMLSAPIVKFQSEIDENEANSFQTQHLLNSSDNDPSEATGNSKKFQNQRGMIISVCCIVFLALLQFVVGLIIYCRHSLRVDSRPRRERQQTQNHNDQGSVQQMLDMQRAQQMSVRHHFVEEEADSPYITKLPELLVRLGDFQLYGVHEDVVGQTCAICLSGFRSQVQYDSEKGQTQDTSKIEVVIDKQADDELCRNNFNQQDKEVDQKTPPSEYRNQSADKWKCEVIRLGCGHCFHHECIREWVVEKEEDVECPICRQIIFKD